MNAGFIFTFPSNLIEACKNCANFIRENISPEILSSIVPELRELIEKKNEISTYKEAEIIGYVIGKYGIDIYAGAGIAKGIKTFRELKRANHMLSFELASLNKENRAMIAFESAKHAENRKQVLQSSNLQIEWAKQERHVRGCKNFNPKKSELTCPHIQALVNKFAGKGQKVVGEIPGSPGYKERIDFCEVIGIYKDEDRKIVRETTMGMIIYSKEGTHVVPARPKDLL